MKPRHKRFVLVGVGVDGLALSASLVLSAFQKKLVYFFKPCQVGANEAPLGERVRVGGLVEKGSVEREADGLGHQPQEWESILGSTGVVGECVATLPPKRSSINAANRHMVPARMPIRCALNRLNPTPFIAQSVADKNDSVDIQ